MTTNRLILVAAVAGLVVAACGGDDGDAEVAAADDDRLIVADGSDLVIAGDGADGGADDVGEEDLGDAAAVETATDSAGDSEEELALAFATCMRDEGVEDWPDPGLNADGSIDLVPGGLGAGGAGAGGFQDADLESAIQTCGPLVEGASFLPDGAGGLDADAQDDLLEFTQCLRDQGLDVDDPDLGNIGAGPPAGGPAAIFGEGFDPGDPAAQDAIAACQGLFTGPGGGFGGGN